MIFKIKDCYLNVENEIIEYNDIIYGRFSQFEEIQDIKTDYYLKFYYKCVDININGNDKKINGKVEKTDIYTIINNVISYIINDSNNMYIHSVVVSNQNNGIMIVGNFRQGKTTLANEFEKEDYEINSTDQTWIEKKGTDIFQVIGSRFYTENKNIKFLGESNAHKRIKISKIIRIIGMCDNGDVMIEEQKNIYHKIKQLADYCNWTNITPIFTDNIELYDIKQYTKEFFEGATSNKLFNVRGDKKKIVERIK